MHTLDENDISDVKNKTAILLDVRADDEVAAYTSKYARHWDVQAMTNGQFPDIDKQQQVFVFCRSGSRSALAKQLMETAGFQNVTNVGGLNDLPKELY